MNDDPDDRDRDPEATLEEWKASMQAEHDSAIADPDPDADHHVTGVSQVSYRVAYEYRDGELEEARTERLHELEPPELLSCACGVRGMTHEEARSHLAALD
jgi:hypothetical protein